MFTTSKTAIRGVRQLVPKLWLGSGIRGHPTPSVSLFASVPVLVTSFTTYLTVVD